MLERDARAAGRGAGRGKVEKGEDEITKPASAYPTARDVVDRVHAALHGERTTVAEVVKALGAASYTPLLFVPSLAIVSPLSGVPGFTTICGALIAMVSLQQIIRRDSLWLPGWLQRRSVRTDRIRKIMRWLDKPVQWLDAVTKRRLRALVTQPMILVPQLMVMVLGAAMPLFELVPLTSSILGLLITVVALGMFTGDGLLVLLGIVAAAGLVAGVGFMI